jgi:hypothetical protein
MKYIFLPETALDLRKSYVVEELTPFSIKSSYFGVQIQCPTQKQ